MSRATFGPTGTRTLFTPRRKLLAPQSRISRGPSNATKPKLCGRTSRARILCRSISDMRLVLGKIARGCGVQRSSSVFSRQSAFAFSNRCSPEDRLLASQFFLTSHRPQTPVRQRTVRLEEPCRSLRMRVRYGEVAGGAVSVSGELRTAFPAQQESHLTLCEAGFSA